jgi:hypothetical protein
VAAESGDGGRKRRYARRATARTGPDVAASTGTRPVERLTRPGSLGRAEDARKVRESPLQTGRQARCRNRDDRSPGRPTGRPDAARPSDRAHLPVASMRERCNAVTRQNTRETARLSRIYGRLVAHVVRVRRIGTQGVAQGTAIATDVRIRADRCTALTRPMMTLDSCRPVAHKEGSVLASTSERCDSNLPGRRVCRD